MDAKTDDQLLHRHDHEMLSFKAWVESQVKGELSWFQRIELPYGIVTPGWSHPAEEKLPHFGLPADLSGMRVLDVGCSEGFFSFEAERRGAAEVVAIDSSPDSIRRFNICRAALGSRVNGFLTNVYDLAPRQFGTFDLVLFYGVLYHLRHPILALEKLRSVCSGTLLMQTHNDETLGEGAASRFYPFGVKSGPEDAPIFDPTVFFVPNTACVRDMLRHVGFSDVEHLSMAAGTILKAKSPEVSKGAAPDHNTAPWS